MTKRPIHLLRLSRHCVFDMLCLEEALLRKSDKSWCIINDGVAKPAAVMGISGKKESLINSAEAKEQQVELIKRFTGGGTVVLDHDSILVSLICESKHTPRVQLFPRPLMKWTEKFYQPVFSSSGDFRLTETDYTFGQLKFGGNAQYISKQRWLHHTSFLWDYDPRRMKCLLHPPKEPEYRKKRNHSDFLCRLKDFFETREAFMNALVKEALVKMNFEPVEVSLEEAQQQVNSSTFLQSTKRIDL